MLKHRYQRFIQEAQKGYSRFFPNQTLPFLHLAAHSHHFWPDTTRDAQMQAWDDAASLVDRKWEKILSHTLPAAQNHIATWLDFPHPSRIAFAPNTHELLLRLLSQFPAHKKLRILTTDGEFYSFDRQMKRFEEEDLVQVERVNCEPLETVEERLIESARKSKPDLIFVSHVFFNSGAVFDYEKILPEIPLESLFVIDGYHAFGAIPVRFNHPSQRVFYMGGGYKYAQSGEGICFLTLPQGFEARPRNTGWFSEYGKLNSEKDSENQIGYGADAYSFMGATFEPTPFYRLNAVFQMLKEESITPTKLNDHVKRLQAQFLKELGESKSTLLSVGDLAHPLPLSRNGNFLCFKKSNAPSIVKKLYEEKGVQTDARVDRLRFGFGLYHDAADVSEVVRRLK